MIDFTALKNIYNNQMDLLLSESGLTIPCNLIFDSTKPIQCPNCLFDTINKKSSNRYNQSGPMPFANGQTCPYCLGHGITQQEIANQDVKLAVITNSKDFIGVVNLPELAAQTICTIDKLSVIKKCSKIIFNTQISTLSNNIFVRLNEPEPVGLGNSRYIFTNWGRS